MAAPRNVVSNLSSQQKELLRKTVVVLKARGIQIPKRDSKGVISTIMPTENGISLRLDPRYNVQAEDAKKLQAMANMVNKANSSVITLTSEDIDRLYSHYELTQFCGNPQLNLGALSDIQTQRPTMMVSSSAQYNALKDVLGSNGISWEETDIRNSKVIKITGFPSNLTQDKLTRDYYAALGRQRQAVPSRSQAAPASVSTVAQSPVRATTQSQPVSTAVQSPVRTTVQSAPTSPAASSTSNPDETVNSASTGWDVVKEFCHSKGFDFRDGVDEQSSQRTLIVTFEEYENIESENLKTVFNNNGIECEVIDNLDQDQTQIVIKQCPSEISEDKLKKDYYNKSYKHLKLLQQVATAAEEEDEEDVASGSTATQTISSQQPKPVTAEWVAVESFCQHQKLVFTNSSTVTFYHNQTAKCDGLKTTLKDNGIKYYEVMSCNENQTQIIIKKCPPGVNEEMLQETYDRYFRSLQQAVVQFCQQHGLAVTGLGKTHSVKYNENASESRRILTMLQRQGVVFQQKPGCANEFTISLCPPNLTLDDLNNHYNQSQQQVPQSARAAAAPSSSRSTLTSAAASSSSSSHSSLAGSAVSMFSRLRTMVTNIPTSASTSTQPSFQEDSPFDDDDSFQIR